MELLFGKQQFETGESDPENVRDQKMEIQAFLNLTDGPLSY